ncbi:MAG TPA: hypothetical protein VIK52_12265 [Opitutaceae bacterium]
MKRGYVSRLLTSAAVVAGANLLVLIHGATRDFFLAPWFCLAAICDYLRVDFAFGAAAGGILTIVTLAIVAMRKGTSKVVAGWFAANAIAALLFLSFYDGHG